MNQQASHHFSQFNSKRIAIIGDVMIDSYLWGKAERISPEAPVPVVSLPNEKIVWEELLTLLSI